MQKLGYYFHPYLLEEQIRGPAKQSLEQEIFAVPNHWMFNMGVVVAFMGALAYVVRVYARLVELGAETPAKNPYVAEMYKLALEGKLYSRSIP